MQKIIDRLKFYMRLPQALLGFWYDFVRFYRFSAWHANMKDDELRNYHIVKLYHSLEKSMSFRERKAESGWTVVYSLLDALIAGKISGSEIGFHDKKAPSIISTFLSLDKTNDNNEQVREKLSSYIFAPQDESYDLKTHYLEDFRQGILQHPEDFFLSRYSLREFKDEIVSDEIIKRAVSLALKTPSVCNRQAWHVYHSSDDDVKRSALKYQTGHRGFGEKIPNLLVVTADLKAFMSGNEHYQHWIDGGMFAMSVIYALHSLGVASCCLNWSQSPRNDKRIRTLIDLKPNHTVIVMIAVGWPDEQNNVCVSARRPLNEVYSTLVLRD